MESFEVQIIYYSGADYKGFEATAKIKEDLYSGFGTTINEALEALSENIKEYAE